MSFPLDNSYVGKDHVYQLFFQGLDVPENKFIPKLTILVGL